MSDIWPTSVWLTKAIVETPLFQKNYRERVASVFTNIFKLSELTDRVGTASCRQRHQWGSDSDFRPVGPPAITHW
jgi:hypothetical protein